MTTSWQILTRGKLSVRADGVAVELRPKERAVVAGLALAHPDSVGVERLIELIWEVNPPSTARKAIHNHVARLRSAADGLVVTDPSGYRLADTVEIDHVTATSTDLLPLADLPDHPDVTLHRHRIEQRIAFDLERDLERAVHATPTPELIDELRAATDAEPYHERRWYLLALAESQLDRRRDALLTIQRARDRLAEVGLTPGERLVELEQAIVAGSAGEPSPTTQHLHPHAGDPFVGRAAELARLRRVWAEVDDTSRPQLVVVEGAAGMGKTRLVDTFCRELDGVEIVWGRHRSATDRAFEPLADAAAKLVDERPGIVGRLGSRLAGLWPLLPDLAPETSTRPAVEPDLVADRLARSLRALLGEVAGSPTIWFVDDVQWASPEVVDVLNGALDGLTGSLLVVATRRPNEGDVDHSLATLERVVPTTTIELDPLTLDEVRELLAVASAGRSRPLDAITAGKVHERTAGLPLYASEVARRLRMTDVNVDTIAVPRAIRTWVADRLGSLDDDLAELLRVAAVVGLHVDTTLLAELTGSTPEQISARCDRLIELGLLVAGHHDLGGLQFTHQLTRDAVYDGIGPNRLESLHLAVAAAVEQTQPTAPDHHRLAHHYRHAGSAGVVPATVHALAAGEHELSIGAWSQATTWFESAAALAPDPGSHAAALVGLGNAQLQRADFGAADRSLRHAIEIAEAHDFAEVQARATLALVGRAGRGAAVAADDAEHVALLRQALGALRLAPADRLTETVTADVERELALSLLLDDAERERIDLLVRSVERMRHLDPPDHGALAKAVLGSRYAKLDPDRLDERLTDIDEVLTFPRHELGSETLLSAHCYRHEDLLRSNEIAAATAALDEAERVVRRYPHPYWAWSVHTWRCLDHIIAGRLDVAEAMAFEATTMRSGIAGAEACLAVNLVDIRLYQGRAHEVLAPLEQALAANPRIPAYRAVFALCASEAGDADRAAELLHEFAKHGFENLPRDTSRFLGLAVLAHVAADVGDVDAAEQLRGLLAPYGSQWVVLSCYGGGGASWGPVSHARARLAETVGDLAEARDLYDDAARRSAHAPLAHDRIVQHRDTFSSAPAR